MLESFLLVISLCVDACVASFAYGVNKIKISFLSGFMLTFISTMFLALSLIFGNAIRSILPSHLTSGICFSILFFLGFFRLFEGLLKNFLNKRACCSDHLKFTLFDFTLILNVYADATLADLDHSKTLSVKEASYLGVALSLDSLIVGFGAAMDQINILQTLVFCVIFNSIAILLGGFLGRKWAEKLSFDLSWVSGLLLILLSFIKFF